MLVAVLIFATSIFVSHLYLQQQSTTQEEQKFVLSASTEADIFLNGSQLEDKEIQLSANDFIEIQGEGLAAIISPNGNIIRLNTGAKVDIIELDPFEIRLQDGQIWVSNHKPSVLVYAFQSSIYVAHATAAFNMEESKVNIQSLYHYLTVNLHQTPEEEPLRTISLPTQSQITLYKDQVSEIYNALTPKKLKKELKQSILSFERIKNDEWIQKNTILDISYFAALNQKSLPGILVYSIQNFLGAMQQKIILSPHKKRDFNIAYINKAFDEIQILLRLDREYQTVLDNMHRAIDSLAFEDQYQQLLELYFASAGQNQKSIYPLTEDIYAKLEEKIESPKENNDLRIFHLKQITNFIEESLVEENTRNRAIFIKELQQALNTLDETHTSYRDLDDIRTIFLSLILNYPGYSDIAMLDLYEDLSNKQLNIARNLDIALYQDLQFELLENKINIANYLIEKSGRYSLAIEYIETQGLKRQIEDIPDSFAAKGHFEEFLWLVQQKGKNYIHSSSDIKDKDFIDYIKEQEKISLLEERLRESGTFEVDSPILKEFTETELPIESQTLQQIAQNFQKIGIEVAARNIHLLPGTANKFSLTDAKYGTFVFQCKYNLGSDSIYELTLNNTVTRLSMNRSQLPAYLKNIDKIDANGQSETIYSISHDVSSQDQISKLQSQIVKNEMNKWDIYVQTRNIIPVDNSFQIFEIYNANILNKLVNFTYDKNTKTVSNVYMIQENLQLKESMELPDLLLEIENILLQNERSKEILLEIQQKFLSHGFTVKTGNMSFTDESFTQVSFNNASSSNIIQSQSISGIFDNSSSEFISLELPNVSFTNIKIKDVRLEYLKSTVVPLLEESGFNTETLEITIGSDAKVQLQNFSMDDYLLTCSLKVTTNECSDITVNQNPLKLQKELITIEQLAGIINEFVKIKEMKEEKKRSQETETQQEANNDVSALEGLKADIFNFSFFKNWLNDQSASLMKQQSPAQ